MQARPVSERAARVIRDAVDRDKILKRHLEPSWPEWTLREFARYFYVLGAFALLVLGSLQIGALAAPVGDPASAAPAPEVLVLAIAFVVAVLYLAARGYVYLWGKGGWVDRYVEGKGLAPPPGSPPE